MFPHRILYGNCLVLLNISHYNSNDLESMSCVRPCQKHKTGRFASTVLRNESFSFFHLLSFSIGVCEWVRIGLCQFFCTRDKTSLASGHPFLASIPNFSHAKANAALQSSRLLSHAIRSAFWAHFNLRLYSF